MTSWYPWLVVFHVLTALWVSVAAFGGTVLRASVRRAPDFAARIAVLRAGLRIGLVFGLIGGLTVGLSGIALALANPAYIRQGWVHAAIGLWLFMLLLNNGFLAPRMRKMLAAGEASLAAGGGPNEEFKRLMAKPVPPWLAELPAVVVVIFVILMVLKPF